MIVVKLGGSLYGSSDLQHWLTTLKSLSNQHSIIIVPGGGPFADNVRSAQDQHLFDDSTAHHMAILAMAQFGLLLRGISSDSHCYRYNDIPKPAHPFSIWIPDESLLSETDLAHSWDISSDSLALWLANKLSAQLLVLVKSCDIPDHPSISQLAKREIIDKGFQQLYQTSSLPLLLINSKEHQRLVNLIPATPASP